MMMQPVMMQQPVMMAQPMMMAPQPMYQQPMQQQPQIVINQNDDGDCPQCKKGVMIAEKACSCWTCLVCFFCLPGLCCDCAWGKKRKCLSCAYEVKL